MQTTTDSSECIRTKLIRHVSNHSISYDEAMLPVDFKPSATHILCGRTKDCFHHPGNRHFRDSMSMFADDYKKCRTKVDKSLVVLRALNFIQEGNDSSRFIRQDKTTGRWFNLREKAAKEKVGHAIRDIINNREKTAQRRNTREKMHNQPKTTKPIVENNQSNKKNQNNRKVADALILDIFRCRSEENSNSHEPVSLSENLEANFNITAVVSHANVANFQVKSTEPDCVAIAPRNMDEDNILCHPEPQHRGLRRISLTDEQFDENDALILKDLFKEI